MKKSIIFIICLILGLVSCVQTPHFKDAYGYRPIYPDYMDVTIPVGIAPLNFTYTLEGAEKAETIISAEGQQYRFRGRDIEWSMRKWKKLMSGLKEGGTISVWSSILDSTWNIYVSPDPIDYGLAYRLLSPGYETAGFMGIYERDLSSFKERTILSDTQFDCCMNCHCFNQCEPEYFSLHIRGGHAATLLAYGDRIEAFSTATDSTMSACAYPYWHPSGDFIAYSTNQTRQCFHMQQGRPLDVYDEDSDLVIYDIKNNCLIAAESIKSKEMWENYPAFSPDGKTLYFCSCPGVKIPEERDQTRYNLCSVSFDPETGTIGKEIHTLVDARAIDKDIAFPRPSYDGKYLMYTLFDNTAFPIWHDESDLWILDLESGQTFPAEKANSSGPESYHSWSSNSRWFVLSSRRDDGRYTRAYICHINEDGCPDKAFMLPQKRPLQYYSTHSRSFNLPEFISGPVKLNKPKTQKTVLSPARKQFTYRTSD